MSDQNLHFEDNDPKNDPREEEIVEVAEQSQEDTVREDRAQEDTTPEVSSHWDGTHPPQVSPPPRYEAPPSTPAKKRGVPVWTIVLTVVLCALISFGGGLAGIMVAARAMPEIFGGFVEGDPSETDSAGESEALESESTPSYLQENPEDVLEKSESNSSIYGSAGEDVFAISGVARKVSDAVVVIEAKIKSTMFGQSTVQTSSGSGVVISADGYVLTCNHVVEGASEVEVILNSGDRFAAVLVGSDAASDLAVLKINPAQEGETFVFVEQGCSEDLVLGEQVVAIGNPLGTLGGTVTTGIVSATEREIQMSDGSVMTLIQTDAAINSGNSGGGLFNLDGQLIGIVNAKYSASGVEGLAFAIPIDSAYTVQLDLIEYGYVRGVVDHGLELLEVSESALSYYHYRYGLEEAGVYIVDSEYSEELKNADLIRSVNGTKIATAADFDAVLEECAVGDTVTFVVARKKTVGLRETWEDLTVTLELREFVPDRLKGTND